MLARQSAEIPIGTGAALDFGVNGVLAFACLGRDNPQLTVAAYVSFLSYAKTFLLADAHCVTLPFYWRLAHNGFVGAGVSNRVRFNSLCKLLPATERGLKTAVAGLEPASIALVG
jgi:hypothetical protein